MPQTAGTVAAAGLIAEVVIVRDRSGIPHIAAANLDDLFFAQGFIQAQDRLFQIDLWRRAAQGRLSEVLGANFIERDAMTRRMQYRGDIEREWGSYGPDTRRIATAFTRGINAWIAEAGQALPEEFALAGWTPEPWRPEDLLNRTDGFLASVGAQEEIGRARLIARLGAAAVDRLLPLPNNARAIASGGVDFAAITHVLGETIQRAGAAPFFSGFAAASGVGSNVWVVPPEQTETGAAILAVDPHRRFTHPSSRYLVHLTAPGWNVVGATAPWRPGIAIGHNEQVAWGATSSAIDVQDIYVERLNPANPHQVARRGGWVEMEVEHDAIKVKGRAEPFEYDRLYTSHGVVVGLDRERHLAYTLRWTGFAPGTAPELAALQLDRTASAAEFRTALRGWKAPPSDFVYADRRGVIGRQVAALVPARSGSGALPAAGWSGTSEWTGWRPLDALPHASGATPIVLANDNQARTNRIRAVLTSDARHSVESAMRLQQDTYAWNADKLIALLGGVPLHDGAAEEARRRLLAWDRRVSAESSDAQLYVTWEQVIARTLAERHLPAEFVNEIGPRLPLVDILTHPSAVWFGEDPARTRDDLLIQALASASRRPAADRQTVFAHPLGITARARERFNLGPFRLPGYRDTVFAVSGNGSIGPAFRAVFDLSDWDRAKAMNAPGQSEWPDSPHFSDLARLWAAGDYVPLPFSERAIRASANETLTLIPR